MVQANPDPRQKKRLHWVGNSLKDLMEFPEVPRKAVGGALGAAQFGEIAEDVKKWKGEGAGVFEIVEPHDGNAYRAVYAAAFKEAVYVLHAFQKISGRRIEDRPKGHRSGQAGLEGRPSPPRREL